MMRRSTDEVSVKKDVTEIEEKLESVREQRRQFERVAEEATAEKVAAASDKAAFETADSKLRGAASEVERLTLLAEEIEGNLAERREDLQQAQVETLTKNFEKTQTEKNRVGGEALSALGVAKAKVEVFEKLREQEKHEARQLLDAGGSPPEKDEPDFAPSDFEALVNFIAKGPSRPEERSRKALEERAEARAARIRAIAADLNKRHELEREDPSAEEIEQVEKAHAEARAAFIERNPGQVADRITSAVEEALRHGSSKRAAILKERCGWPEIVELAEQELESREAAEARQRERVVVT